MKMQQADTVVPTFAFCVVGLVGLVGLLVADVVRAENVFTEHKIGQEFCSASDGGYAETWGDKPLSRGDLFPKRAKNRFISIQFGRRSMGGDNFDGRTLYTGESDYVGESETFLVPEIEPALFFGLYVDFRRGPFGGGFGYSRASHDWSFLELQKSPAKATSHFVDFDLRYHVFLDKALQPFVLLGISGNGLRVEEGKIKIESGELGDLGIFGMGLNYGAGADYYLGRTVKLSGGVRGHLDRYNSISGHELDEGMICSGVNYYLSVGFNIDS